MVRVVRATQVEIETAVQALRDGELVAFPTETVYGLGANAQNPAAVRKIFAAKGRPVDHPVIVHLDSPRFLHRWVREVPEPANKLAERFWPGPLTVIVRAGAKLPLRSTANTGNVALRVPDAAIPRAVVAAFALPVTATSANLQGVPECTYAACVRDQIGDRIPLIVDGGPTARSTHTTIVDLSAGGDSWQILREGAIATHEIALALQN